MQPNSFRSILSATTMALALTAGASVAGVMGVAQAQTRTGVRIPTRLAGGAINGVAPSGSARFRSCGNARNFSVEVEDVNLANGAVLTVSLMRGGVSIPAVSMVLTARLAEIDVSTNDGDVAPQAKSGDAVVVADATGRALLSGVLR